MSTIRPPHDPPSELPPADAPSALNSRVVGPHARRSRLLRTSFGWLVTAGLALALAFTVPLREVVEGFRRLDPWAALGAMLVVGLTLWLRGGRWSVLFSSHHRVPSMAAAEVAIFGLALNAVLPGRVGEVARVAIACRRFGMKLGFAAGTVVAERLLDGVTLFLFLGGALVALPSIVGPGSVEILGSEVPGRALATTLTSLGVLCLLLVVAAVVISFARPTNLPAVWARRLPPRIARIAGPSLRTLLVGLRAGMTGLRRPGDLARVAIYSLAIWLGVALANLVVALGIPGLELSFSQALIVTAVSVAASSLPSAPGAWGVFEAGGVLALQAMLPELETGLALAFMIAAHACQYVPTVAAGYLLWLAGRSRGRQTTGQSTSSTADDTR